MSSGGILGVTKVDRSLSPMPTGVPVQLAAANINRNGLVVQNNSSAAPITLNIGSAASGTLGVGGITLKAGDPALRFFDAACPTEAVSAFIATNSTSPAVTCWEFS